MSKTPQHDARALKAVATRKSTRAAASPASAELLPALPGLTSPASVMQLQRTAGNSAVHRIIAHRLSAQPAIQREGNWDDFKNFAGNQWQGFKGDVGSIGSMVDPRPAYQSHAARGGWHNMRRGAGAAALRVGVGGPLGLLGGLGSGVGRGLATMGAGAYYGARGLGSYASEGAQALGQKISKGKKTAWDPLTGDQQATMIGNTGGGVVSGLGGVGSGLGNLINPNISIPQGLSNQADISIGQGGTPLTQVSDVGQGFTAAGGIGTGLGGMVNMGSGLGNLFGKKEEGKGYQRATRGAGRFLMGGAQAFTGAAVAGKSIGALTGAATAGSSFLASAVLPAQAALSGIDIVRGSYMLNKARRRKNALRDTQHDFEDQRNQQTIRLGEEDGQYQYFGGLAQQAQMAKQYQNQRKRTAGINLAAGVLGGLGAGLTLSGVGAVAGVPLMIAAGLLKLGGSMYGAVRDRTWGKRQSSEGRMKDDGTRETHAEVKGRKETEWATYMAQNYQDPNVKRILKDMGAESFATNDETMGELSLEQRIEVMRKQLMKR